MVEFACVYALVALCCMAGSRLSGGPWVDAVDFGLDALVCALWPLGMCVLAFDCIVRVVKRHRGRRL